MQGKLTPAGPGVARRLVLGSETNRFSENNTIIIVGGKNGTYVMSWWIFLAVMYTTYVCIYNTGA